MIDGCGKASGISWRTFLAGALLLAAICAVPQRAASAEEPAPGTEAVSGSGQEAAESPAAVSDNSAKAPGTVSDNAAAAPVALSDNSAIAPGAALDNAAAAPGAVSDNTATAPGAVSEDAGNAAPEDLEPLPEKPAVQVADPLEPVNRAFFVFNDRLYFWVLKPVARGYGFVVPEPLRIGIRNAFTNILMPVRFVNSLLQGKVKGAGRELARFVVNSTIGMGTLRHGEERLAYPPFGRRHGADARDVWPRTRRLPRPPVLRPLFRAGRRRHLGAIRSSTPCGTARLPDGTRGHRREDHQQHLPEDRGRTRASRRWRSTRTWPSGTDTSSIGRGKSPSKDG